MPVFFFLTAMLIKLGFVVATPGAIKVMDQCQVLPWTLLYRHASGDWGCVSMEDAQANEDSIKEGLRILSAYVLGDEKVWIITEADRSSTCILLPSEY